MYVVAFKTQDMKLIDDISMQHLDAVLEQYGAVHNVRIENLWNVMKRPKTGSAEFWCFETYIRWIFVQNCQMFIDQIFVVMAKNIESRETLSTSQILLHDTWWHD